MPSMSTVKEEARGADLPIVARQALLSFVDQIGRLKQELARLNKQLIAWHRASEESSQIGDYSRHRRRHGVGYHSLRRAREAVSVRPRVRGVGEAGAEAEL